MNNVSKQYLSDIKTLFPIMGKEEKRYLKKLKTIVEDFCAEAEPDCQDILYKEFGTPDEILASYIKSADIPYIIKKIRQTKILKFSISVTLCIIIIVLAIHFSCLYKEYKAFQQSIPFFEETIIE